MPPKPFQEIIYSPVVDFNGEITHSNSRKNLLNNCKTKNLPVRHTVSYTIFLSTKRPWTMSIFYS